MPSLFVVSDAFVDLIRIVGRAKGYDDVPHLVLPHPPSALSPAELTTLAQGLSATAAATFGISVNGI